MLGQTILGKYKVQRQLDEGGMSKVYVARQADNGREVVVKVLKESLRSQPKTVEHFRREIHIMSRFSHPHAVAYYDSDVKGPGSPVLVMEYLRGIDLAGLLGRERRFTPDRTGRLLAQLCDVLQAAHDAGIVHRDLKPGNIMALYSGTPQETLKVMDFGLAKMSSMLYISPDELVDFRLPAASGTPEYISPEMVRGNEMDGRSDLYSVGVVLYEMLTGRRPFLHPRVEDLMVAHADAVPPSFAEAGARDVPPAIEAVVRSCLEKHPDQRPATAAELAQAYEKALGRRLLSGRPLGASGLVRRPPPAALGTGVSDRNAVRHTIEASMPEVMAMIKLKGFIGDLGGEVLESVPGMIKVRMHQKAQKGSGLFSWGKRVTPVAAFMADIELHMERRDPGQPSKLTITLLVRPGESGLLTPEFKERCGTIHRDLQAYLMGR